VLCCDGDFNWWGGFGGVGFTIRTVLKLSILIVIFDPALLDLEVAIAKNVVYFHRNE
jgi:hypothetical protein